MSLGIISIDHVQIAVPRVLEAECLTFYREILSLPEIPKPEKLRARGGAWFQVGKLQMHIGVDPQPSPPSKRHLCFLTADLNQARSTVQTAKITIEDDSVADGLVRFFIRDPAGNRIEIAQQ